MASGRLAGHAPSSRSSPVSARRSWSDPIHSRGVLGRRSNHLSLRSAPRIRWAPSIHCRPGQRGQGCPSPRIDDANKRPGSNHMATCVSALARRPHRGMSRPRPKRTRRCSAVAAQAFALGQSTATGAVDQTRVSEHKRRPPAVKARSITNPDAGAISRRRVRPTSAHGNAPLCEPSASTTVAL